MDMAEASQTMPTPCDVEQRIRERAYFLWRQEGCPPGLQARHWEQARRIEAEHERYETRIDVEEEGSFPASDPPSHSVIVGERRGT